MATNPLPNGKPDQENEPDDRPISHDGSTDEFIRDRRLREIFEARERVAEVHSSAFAELALKNMAREQVQLLYRRAVDHYITTVEPLIHQHDKRDHYWENVELGTITFEPPEELREEWIDDPHVKVVEGAGMQTLPISGLKEMLEMDDVVKYPFTIEVELPHQGKRTVTKPAKQPFPRTVVTNAYRATNEFLQESALDIDLSPADDPMKV